MKLIDLRLDETIFKSMIRKKFRKFRCDEFNFTNTVTGIVGLYIGSKVFELRNELVDIDYFGNNEECSVWQISEIEKSQIKSMLIKGKQIDNIVDDKINKIIIINEKQSLYEDEVELYCVIITRAIIFSVGDKEIAFIKDNVPFSEEIEILKGHDLVESVSENLYFTKDAEWDENFLAKCERVVVEIS